MKLLLALCILIPPGCSAEVMPPPRAYVTKMSLAEGKESYLECNTGAWTGRVTIAPDVKVGYKNVTVTTPRNTESKTTLTLNEVMMTVEKNGLLFGADTRVPLSGEVAVEVRSLCVHGDTPGAVELAKAVRAALDEAGVTLEAFA